MQVISHLLSLSGCRFLFQCSLGSRPNYYKLSRNYSLFTVVTFIFFLFIEGRWASPAQEPEPSKGKGQKCRDWDRGHSDISPGHFIFVVWNQSLTCWQCYLETLSPCSSTVLQNIFPMFWKGIFYMVVCRSKFKKKNVKITSLQNCWFYVPRQK